MCLQRFAPPAFGSFAGLVVGGDRPAWSDQFGEPCASVKELAPGDDFQWFVAFFFSNYIIFFFMCVVCLYNDRLDDKWKLTQPQEDDAGFVSQTDQNGWQYAASWSTTEWSAKSGMSSLVRRRFWKRVKVKRISLKK